MLIKTKVFTIGLGITALAAALFSFTDGENDEKKKKYHVIHQKDGELTMHDTILPMSSNYTVENFLADKGIDDENVEVIKIPSFGKHMMFHGEGMEGKPHVMIKEFSHDIEIEGEDGESKEVKIMMEVDEDGNKVVKKWVNGEEVEMTPEELEKMEKRHHMHGHGEHVVIEVDEEVHVEGDHERVEIKVEIDEEGNKVITKIVDGEEIEMTEEELEKIHHGMKGEHMMIKMDGEHHGMHHGEHEMTFEVIEGDEAQEVKIQVEIDDEGNHVIKKWVDGEEVEMTEEEMQKMQKHRMHNGHGNMMMFHMDESEMTEEEKAEMKRMMEEHMSEMNINIDSLHEVMEEGNVFIHKMEIGDHHSCGDKCEGKCEHHKSGAHGMKMMHKVHGDEDFTIVLVHEDMTDEEIDSLETQMQSHREMMVSEDEMVVFPNPNNGVFTIQFEQSEKAKTRVEIMDAQGKVVFSDKLGKFTGTYKKEVDLKEHGAGMYIVNIQQGDDLKSHKIVVE